MSKINDFLFDFLMPVSVFILFMGGGAALIIVALTGLLKTACP